MWSRTSIPISRFAHFFIITKQFQTKSMNAAAWCKTHFSYFKSKTKINTACANYKIWNFELQIVLRILKVSQMFSNPFNQ